MSYIGAVAELIAAEPSGDFGQVGVRIWAPLIPSDSALPAMQVSRYEGALIDTFGLTEEQPRIQVLFQSNPHEYEEGEALFERVCLWLADKRGVTYDGVTISYLRWMSGMLPLGRDANGCYQWSANFELTHA